MEQPVPIDQRTWPRREHFAHYRRAVPCTSAMTVDLDVTEFATVMATSTHKTYLAQVWALASVVNAHEEFRMASTAGGEPAVWPLVHPSFTVFNGRSETFASVWAPYDPDFGRFHEAALPVLVEHADATGLFPQGAPPPNVFDVSSIPWTSFTGFALSIRDGFDHLAPIFTIGRYRERDGRTLMPLAVQVHHAAADGFHVARLVDELQQLLAEPDWVTAS
jgi:chloramphenicol O-acetyltransferase type A